jgi:hypothetical protein
MTPLSSALVFLGLSMSCSSVPTVDSYGGIYSSNDGIIELHRGPDSAWRGYWRTNERIAALAPVNINGDVLEATATYDDGTRADVRAVFSPGPVLVLDGRSHERSAVEKPASPEVRREIEEGYDLLAQAVAEKDYDAFQALRVTEFATIPPDGVPSPGSRMAERARGLLERIQPPITVTNDILELTMRGNEAIATVRQKFTRMQQIEGTPHTIHTEVTQRETWTRTPLGWKLLFVDEVRDPLTLDNGRRVQ